MDKQPEKHNQGLLLLALWVHSRTVVSCPASFHSHAYAEEKSLVKCLDLCSVRQDLGAPIRLQNVSYVITFAKGII